ncbi:MAG: ATP-binding cassette domain-containing protein [Ruminococcaceae bacterium]|nr:ATP-binding cassette domain-containing protein [Oscillospiraceae bacterium]
MITLEHIEKTYRVARRNAGMGEALRALFHREYTLIPALQDVSFQVADGEMVGYIGPNGAGKSSTIKIMSGILHPDGGTCVIDGLTPWKNRREHVRNIGVVFGQRSQLWWDVPVIDSFELIRDIYQVDAAAYRRSYEELVTLLGLGDIVRTPARQLSLGQRMRCEIAASLLHEPRILFLDEPTIGLDAVSKLAVRDFIRKINQERGTTVILTTHDMQDIEALTERVLLIGKGKILLDDTLDALKARSSHTRRLQIRYTGALAACPAGTTLVSQEAGQAAFSVDTDVCPVSRAIEALSRQVEITDLTVENISAEELVVSLYEEYAI